MKKKTVIFDTNRTKTLDLTLQKKNNNLDFQNKYAEHKLCT